MSIIKTTVNLDKTIYSRLRNASEQNGICIHELVRVLITLFRNEPLVKITAFSRLRYQERIKGREWEKLHISLRESSYETCMDFRKLYKYSFSRLLSMAIEQLLEKAVEMVRGGFRDNYHDFYLLMTNIASEQLNYMISYILPSKKILKFLFNT